MRLRLPVSHARMASLPLEVTISPHTPTAGCSRHVRCSLNWPCCLNQGLTCADRTRLTNYHAAPLCRRIPASFVRMVPLLAMMLSQTLRRGTLLHVQVSLRHPHYSKLGPVSVECRVKCTSPIAALLRLSLFLLPLPQ